jgi:phosphoserine phosphatase
MSYVLTLIANPDKKQITSGRLDEIISLLQHEGLVITDSVCLSENEAYDLYTHTILEASSLRKMSQDLNLDIISQPHSNRQKKLLIADMDSTIVTGETLDDLAEFAGIKDEVAAITARAMNGEIKFRDALHERVKMLKGLSAAFMEEAMQKVELTKGAQTLVQTMKANGAYCALVSGGFTFFTERVAKQVGFDFNAGNRMEIIDGLITGNVIDPILTKDSKLAYLKSLASEQGITPKDCVAVGDGANDLPMILEAGLGIAFHAKASVVTQAKHNVQEGDLRSLLFAQGYTTKQFVSEI